MKSLSLKSLIRGAVAPLIFIASSAALAGATATGPAIEYDYSPLTGNIDYLKVTGTLDSFRSSDDPHAFVTITGLGTTASRVFAWLNNTYFECFTQDAFTQAQLERIEYDTFFEIKRYIGYKDGECRVRTSKSSLTLSGPQTETKIQPFAAFDPLAAAETKYPEPCDDPDFAEVNMVICEVLLDEMSPPKDDDLGELTPNTEPVFSGKK